MFTEKNYILTPGKKYGDEYVKTPINEITTKNEVVALQLPFGGISFFTPLEEVVVAEYEASDEKPEIYDLVFENSMGHRYTVQMDPSDIEIFCKFSKFKNLGLLISWAANFCTLDWRGLPTKLISATKVNMPQNEALKLYKLKTKEAHSVLVSGIVFNSKDDSSAPLTAEDINSENDESENI